MSPRLASRITGTCGAADVGDQQFELLRGAVCGKVGDLRFERQHQIRRGVDDGGAEVADPAGIALGRVRESGIGFSAAWKLTPASTRSWSSPGVRWIEFASKLPSLGHWHRCPVSDSQFNFL